MDQESREDTPDERELDFDHGVSVLAKAYASNAPAFEFIHAGNYGEADARFYFERYVGWGRDSLEGIVTEDGAIFWLKPDTRNPFLAMRLRLRLFWDYLRHYGVATVWRLVKLSRIYTKLKGEVPAGALEAYSFGVVPARQGVGVGTELLELSRRKLLAERRPYYIFTQYECNVRLYQKFGFRVVSEKRVGAHTGYAMLRDPMTS